MERAEAIARAEPRNLIVLTLHYMALRLAWIFKTETVLIPAFLDVISGAGWVRGCLPILNRVGQSLAPLMTAQPLRRSPRKVVWLIGSCVVMSIPFFILAGLCLQIGTRPLPWLPALFLLLYTLFFATTGVNQMAFNTLQGKLISVQRRGRLMSLAGMAGSVVAILAAYFLLTEWLTMADGPGFARIFGFNAITFALAGMVLWGVSEPADVRPAAGPARQLVPWKAVWQTLREDEPVRRLSIVTMLFMTNMLLFPHYQWLGRTALQAGGTDLMWWVIVQNAGVGLLSWASGRCADRYGYRVVLRYQIFASACTPGIAYLLSQLLNYETRAGYMLTFFLLGLVPVTIKSLFNFVLELAPSEQHPHYLSTLSLCMALPLFLAPVAGWLIDLQPIAVFACISLLIAAGGWLTFSLHEPRKFSD